MRILVVLMALLVCPVILTAQDSALKRLDTSDDGQGWDAVGRLDIGGVGFCTGSLIAPDIVLTAAHCLYDKSTGVPIRIEKIEFRAGWRNGRASAYRYVRQAVVHPDYDYNNLVTADRVRNDIALLRLQRPIRNTTVVPFETAQRPRTGDNVGVVSYAQDRAEAPSLQKVCDVMGRQEGVLILSCDVDFGSSGAPIFTLDGQTPRIVSVVSAKAEVDGTRVALGTQLDQPLNTLHAQLAAGQNLVSENRTVPSTIRRIAVGSQRATTGAKFVKP